LDPDVFDGLHCPAGAVTVRGARWFFSQLAFVPCAAGAHALDDAVTIDTGAAVVLALLALAVLLFGVGSRRLRRKGGAHAQAGRDGCFAMGALALGACLLPPLDVWSSNSFFAHMVQHELLMLVAAPLLVLGRPLPVFLWAFPERLRRRIAVWTSTAAIAATWRALMHPATGWAAHAVALWAWHVPVVFRAALENQALHDLQHFTFVLTALLFWSGLMLQRAPGAGRGLGVLYLFTTTVHTGVLGALITFATEPLYTPDILMASVPDALRDQQLGGLTMWVPGSMVYVAAGLVLFLRWVRASDRTVWGKPDHSPAVGEPSGAA
jgi:putative membrane protein